MVRFNLVIFQILKALVYVMALMVFLSVFDFSQVTTYEATGETVIFLFFDSVKNMFSYLIYGGLYVIAIGCIFVSTSLFWFVNPAARIDAFTFVDNFFKNYFGTWFSFPDGIPELFEIPEKLWTEFSGFLSYLYLISFQILIIISVVYAIRATLKSNSKHDMIAIGSLVLMIVIPLIIAGFNEMLLLFYIRIDFLQDLPNPLSQAFFNLPINNFFLFLASPVVLLAILSYVYLELAFQTNYIQTVTKPSLERSDRLEAQILILQSESHHITANIDQIKEEAKARKQELEIEDKESVSQFFLKVGERFSYVKEMIAKKKLEEEEKKLLSAASKTRRLGRYIDRLFIEDREAHDTLTARSSAPRSKKLILSTFLNMAVRLVILIILSYIIIHPQLFFVEVLHLPPSITESVEMFSPEIILILLLPIVLIFPIASKIISFIKHRSLIIRLQQEGRIKEILASVGDYVKKEELSSKTEQVEIGGTASETA